MAKFCIVAPLSILEPLHERHHLGVDHLLLAHDIVKRENRDRYYNLFTSHIGISPKTVILDNSVIELGNSVDLNMIAEAAAIVKPSCIALPDVLLDTNATISSCSNALPIWADKFQNMSFARLNPGIFMIIPQGKSLHDFARCAEAFMEDPRIGWWGVPRNLVKWIGTRRDAIRIVHALNPRRKIHMMGFSDDMVDDLICATMPEVWSIDSAVPLRHGSEFSITDHQTPRGDWWDTAKMTQWTEDNIRIVRKMFRGAL